MFRQSWQSFLRVSKEATGIDLADIVKADTYDAKVNRNVNVSGIDSVNLVVKDEKENPTT